MISYFYSGKGRRQLKVCEDSLTSIVFDTLKYLPAPVFWHIFKSSLYKDKLPKSSGELIEILFWDKWNAANTVNKRYVEPDVLLQFPDFDIIVEAKRHNENQQSPQQLKNQIIAYHNKFREETKDLYYVKLAGLHDKSDEPDFEFKASNSVEHTDPAELINNKSIKVKICKTDWTMLLDSISGYLKKIENNDTLMSGPTIRILSDCINGFALHQYYKKHWLSDLKSYGNINFPLPENYFNYAKRA